MKEQKYRTELTYNKFLEKYALMRSHEIYIESAYEENKEILDKSHNYFICIRPKFRIKKESFSEDNFSIYGEVEYKSIIKNQNEKTTFEIKKKQFPIKEKFSIKPDDKSETDFLITLENGQMFKIPFYLLINAIDVDRSIKDEFNLKIEYIGRSYGEDGNQISFSRIKNHEKLQRILAETLHRNPDSEIYILFAVFSNAQIQFSIDGIENPNKSDSESAAHVAKALSHNFDPKLGVFLTEACLIKYFKPNYNKIHKEKIPDEKSKTLSDLVLLDIYSISIEISLNNASFELFSEYIPSKSDHIISYPIRSEKDRKSFFENFV